MNKRLPLALPSCINHAVANFVTLILLGFHQRSPQAIKHIKAHKRSCKSLVSLDWSVFLLTHNVLAGGGYRYFHTYRTQYMARKAW